jgi:hypothetical protein
MSEKRTHPNKVTGYLKPKNEALFRGFTSTNEVSDSEAVNIMVKDFFSRLPPEEKIIYLSKARSRNTY